MATAAVAFLFTENRHQHIPLSDMKVFSNKNKVSTYDFITPWNDSSTLSFTGAAPACQLNSSRSSSRNDTKEL